MIKVLFVCIHNSARSQMAEELLRLALPNQIQVISAGLEPGKINPVVAEVLLEKGIDIRQKETQSVFELLKQGKTYNFVITVCDETSGERCPIFPGRINRLHWSFADPSAFTGSHTEKLEQTRKVCQEVEQKIAEFVLYLRQQEFI
jgi:arsenate reductase